MRLFFVWPPRWVFRKTSWSLNKLKRNLFKKGRRSKKKEILTAIRWPLMYFSCSELFCQQFLALVGLPGRWSASLLARFSIQYALENINKCLKYVTDMFYTLSILPSVLLLLPRSLVVAAESWFDWPYWSLSELLGQSMLIKLWYLLQEKHIRTHYSVQKLIFEIEKMRSRKRWNPPLHMQCHKIRAKKETIKLKRQYVIVNSQIEN